MIKVAKITHIKAVILLLVIFSLCVSIYLPGLSGGFLFDDFANLPTLGHYGPIDNIEAFKLYITSGIAGPTGRPISLLSFLIDAQNWPADPWPFKRTNIIVHLFNGLLLYFLCLKTLQILRYSQKQSVQIALLASLIWLIHPLFVSTVLYPVQRMTQLSASFVMLGLLFYISLRLIFLKKPTAKSIITLSIGVPLFTLLATFSKENGALLPLLIFVYEFVIIKQVNNNNLTNKVYSYWFIIFIILPTLLISAYFIKIALSYDIDNNIRAFSLYERLLTESRILVHYLYQLIIPHSSTSGIYHDGMTISTSLLSPPTTFLSVIAIGLMIFFSIKIRKNHPLLSLSILFFFIAHIMESGVIMLELYFEHRNYLPSIFLFLPLANILVINKTLKSQYKIALVIIIIFILGALTYSRTSLWGSPLKQSIVWSISNPSSPRTQTILALKLQQKNLYSEAEKIFEQAIKLHPDNLMLRINLFGNRCTQNKLTKNDINELNKTIISTKRGNQIIYKIIDKLIENQCSNLKLTDIENIIQKLLLMADNKTSLKLTLFNLYGKLKLKQNEPDKALSYFKQSLLEEPSYDKVLSQTALLASNQDYTQALELLDYFESIHLEKQNTFLNKMRVYYTEEYFKSEIIRLKKVIQEDIQNEM